MPVGIRERPHQLRWPHTCGSGAIGLALWLWAATALAQGFGRGELPQACSQACSQGCSQGCSDAAGQALVGKRAGASIPPGKQGELRPPAPVPARRFGLEDYVVTAGLVTLYYMIEFTLDGPREAHLSGPVPIVDEAARGLFRLDSRAARDAADRVSDYGWGVSTAYPVLLSIVAPLAGDGTFDQIWQMSMMNLQAYAVASILVRIPHKLVGRLRPAALGCRTDPNYSSVCNTNREYLSFFGGHTAISMTGAGLACAHHQHARLLGGRWDGLGCALALATATTVFVTRMQADKHWLSDQLLSIAVGLGTGYGLPTLLYYHPIIGQRRTAQDTAKAAATVLPVFSDALTGATLVGYF